MRSSPTRPPRSACACSASSSLSRPTAPWATRISPSTSPARLRAGVLRAGGATARDGASIRTSTPGIGLLFLWRRLRRRGLGARRGLVLRLGGKGGRRGRRRRHSALIHLRRRITLDRADHPLVVAPGSTVLELAQLLRDAAAHARERTRLAVVVDRGQVLRIVAVEPLHELGPLAHLPLEDAAVVALVADDVGREEEQQVRLLALGALVAEEPAEHRQRPQQRHLLHALGRTVLDEA